MSDRLYNDKKYSATMGEPLIECLANGGTVAEFCKLQNIRESSFYNWVKNYEEFARAYERAKTFKHAFHHSEMRKNLENEKLQPHVYKAYLRWVAGLKEDPETSVTINNNKVDEQLLEDMQEFRKQFEQNF